MNLGKNVKITKGLPYVSGTADRNGATLDMSGYDGLMLIWTFAAIASGAVTSVKVQQDSASGMGTAADLEGTGITVAADDDDQIFIQDIYKPLERYVRGVVDKDAANAAAEILTYIQYQGQKAPEVNTVADLVTYELHVSPAEGTA